MGLKETMAADIGRVFFTDFVTEHRWNDTAIRVIEDREQELRLKQILGSLEDSVNEFMIHVPESDLSKRPERWDTVNFDGIPCEVTSVGKNEKAYEIMLSMRKGRRA